MGRGLSRSNRSINPRLFFLNNVHNITYFYVLWAASSMIVVRNWNNFHLGSALLVITWPSFRDYMYQQALLVRMRSTTLLCLPGMPIDRLWHAPFLPASLREGSMQRWSCCYHPKGCCQSVHFGGKVSVAVARASTNDICGKAEQRWSCSVLRCWDGCACAVIIVAK